MMRKEIFVVVLGMVLPFVGFGQDVVGSWTGTLAVQGQKIELIFHIDEAEDALAVAMDIPAQGARGLKANDVSYADLTLKFSFSQLGIAYEGKLEVDERLIKGTYRQSGIALPLELRPLATASSSASPTRPQEPQPPFPYESEDLFFDNAKAGIKLAGTLTTPRGTGPFPAVILVTGSGPQNRDEELLGHKPFLVITDYLTRRGFAVLRYDDRGIGQSEGDFRSATSADFADDAAAAFEYLKQRDGIDPRNIGLLGHSEGGMVIPMVAADNEEVAFLVLLAAPGIPIDSLMVLQNRMIGKASGMSEQALEQAADANRHIYALLKEELSIDTLRDRLSGELKAIFASQLSGAALDEQVNAQVAALTSPWYHFFIKHDPQRVLAQVKCPVLAINGGLDLQVSPKENLTGIEEALRLGGNTQLRVVELEGLNHLFQTAKTGLPGEYGQIEETMSPVVLDLIAGWLSETITP